MDTPKRRAAASVVLILSLSLILSCKHSQSQQQSNVGAVHHGVGIVDSIDKEMGTMQINHEEIKDYMPPMSMPYAVKDRSLLDSVTPGDRIEFSLEGTTKGDVVSEIKKIESSKKN